MDLRMGHAAYSMPIIESEFLTVFAGIRVRKRTWKERLFTWPWKPWKATLSETLYKPDENVYIVPDSSGHKSIMCHPSVAAQVRASMGNQ
jgi:hypothetical protein